MLIYILFLLFFPLLYFFFVSFHKRYRYFSRLNIGKNSFFLFKDIIFSFLMNLYVRINSYFRENYIFNRWFKARLVSIKVQEDIKLRLFKEIILDSVLSSKVLDDADFLNVNKTKAIFRQCCYSLRDYSIDLVYYNRFHIYHFNDEFINGSSRFPECYVIAKRYGARKILKRQKNRKNQTILGVWFRLAY